VGRGERREERGERREERGEGREESAHTYKHFKLLGLFILILFI
jgi:hypothetical protein